MNKLISIAIVLLLGTSSANACENIQKLKLLKAEIVSATAQFPKLQWRAHEAEFIVEGLERDVARFEKAAQKTNERSVASLDHASHLILLEQAKINLFEILAHNAKIFLEVAEKNEQIYVLEKYAFDEDHCEIGAG